MFRIPAALLASLSLILALSLQVASPTQANTATWSQSGATIPGLNPADETGTSVALNTDGDIVAIGEPQSQVSKAGRVRVFREDSGTWTQMGASLAGGTNGDFFGTSVALSSDGLTLAVGAPGFDITGTSSAGRVTVYRYSGSAWIQRGDPIVGTSTTRSLGTSVALRADGTRVAIGSPQGGGSTEGLVQVFDFTTAWTLVDVAIPGGVANAQSGTSLALSSDGDRLAIGGIGNASGVGQVRVFELAAGAWGPLGAAINGATAGASLGRSVDLNAAGDTLAIGAPGVGNGQVSVYALTGGAWAVKGTALSGEVAGDEFGYAVALNDAGTRLVAGARLADDPGASAGAVRSFVFESGSWQIVGQTITGEAAGDEAGFAVSMSGTGLRIAIGAPKKSTFTGQVRIFDYPEPPAPTITGATASAGLPGIYLHLAGPVGRPVEGSPVYFGSHKIATSSPYELTLQRVGAPAPTILASGATDGRGTLERRLILGQLVPGTYTLTLRGEHAFGTGLWLTNSFTVTPEGTYSRIAENTHGIW